MAKVADSFRPSSPPGACRRVRSAIPAIMVLLAAVVLTTGCGNSYSYEPLRQRAEAALQQGDLAGAKKIYARIFRTEKARVPPSLDRVHWAFYRLGVIHEILNKRVLAKGYYWGDQFDKGYFDASPYVAWLARTGWERFDKNLPPRTFQEILALEAQERPATVASAPATAPIPAKKVTPTAPLAPLPAGTPLRTYDRSLNLPPADVAEPFKVHY